MKKNLSIIILSLTFFIFILVKENLISMEVYHITKFFLVNVMPSIIIMYFISNILFNYNLPYYLTKITHNKALYIFLISILSGIPNNFIILKKYKEENLINADEANNLLQSNLFLNPLFLYVNLNKIFDIKLTIIIIMVSYLSNILIYLKYPLKNNIIIKNKTIPFITLFKNNIKEITNIIPPIYITILIFSILAIFIPDNLGILKGYLEVSLGFKEMISNNYNLFLKIFLIVSYISFGGISIIMQGYIVLDNKLNFKYFLLGIIPRLILNLGLTTMLCAFI